MLELETVTPNDDTNASRECLLGWNQFRTATAWPALPLRGFCRLDDDPRGLPVLLDVVVKDKSP
jgi:hypothetical protein